MKSRQIIMAGLILATAWQAAAAQPKRTRVNAPRLETVLAETNYPQSNGVVSDLIAVKPVMPLGPQDVLKSYEIAMGLVADKTSNDFAVIVQAQHTNQITREQAEYLLQQSYQIAMMQYQMLSALHDVLKHDIEETQKAKASLQTAQSDTVLVVPFPGSAAGDR